MEELNEAEDFTAEPQEPESIDGLTVRDYLKMRVNNVLGLNERLNKMLDQVPKEQEDE